MLARHVLQSKYPTRDPHNDPYHDEASLWEHDSTDTPTRRRFVWYEAMRSFLGHGGTPRFCTHESEQTKRMTVVIGGALVRFLGLVVVVVDDAECCFSWR